MTSQNWPKISIILFVYNEEKNLQRLLPSLTRQTYPKSRIEYIAIDDESTDDSAKLLKDFGARIYTIDRSKISHPVFYRTEYNKGLGLHKSKGEFVYWIDADMEVCDDNFFQKMVQPMIDNPHITGSLTREFALDHRPLPKSSFLRYLSYDNTQRDPVLAFFSTNIEDTIVETRENYYVCKFVSPKVPASGRIMYRRSQLLKTEIRLDPAFYDLDALQTMVDNGFQQYAFVPQAKVRHYHAESFSHFIHKRLRNLEGNFFSTLDKKKFIWFRTDNNQDLFKIVFWSVYANLFLPELIRGIVKSIRHQDLAFLWQPIASFVLTNVLIWRSIRNPTGKRVIKSILGV